jgi:hypothetical protein
VRVLRAKERDLLESVLPLDRPGYRELREMIGGTMVVLGEGRRGEGNLILGKEGETPDLGAPLTPVIAYGVVETTQDSYTISVREPQGGQLDVEIVSRHGREIPDHFEEKRRWSYSEWHPGAPSPATGAPVREISIDGRTTLALAAGERRLWIHVAATGMVVPIPVTNFYNEIMLVKGIRDPAIALNSSKLFEEPDRFTDDDLRAAFVAYNTTRQRVEITPPAAGDRPGGFRRLMRRMFGGRHEWQGR